jgi:hypothetical protein
MDEPRMLPHEDLEVDLSQVIRRLSRVTQEGRQRLANDPATRAYIGAGLRLVDRELGEVTSTNSNEEKLQVLAWLSRAKVSAEVANGPAHLSQQGTQPSMRDRWNAHSDYIADLLSYLLWSYHYLEGRQEEIKHWAEQLVTGPDFVEALHEVAYQDLCTVIELPTLRFQLVASAIAGRDTAIRDALSDSYQAIAKAWLPVYKATLHAHELRLRQGISLDDLAYMITAVTEGFSLRLLGEPDASILDHNRRRTLLGTFVLALIVGCTQRIDDPEELTLEDVVQALLQDKDDRQAATEALGRPQGRSHRPAAMPHAG